MSYLSNYIEKMRSEGKKNFADSIEKTAKFNQEKQDMYLV